MKICKTCNVEKPLEDFYVKKTAKNTGTITYEAHCKYCYNRKPSRLKHKTDHVATFNIYKANLFCTDCKMSFYQRPWLCDFHHVDPTTKEGAISYMIRYNDKRLKEELAKCIPLCSNCHRTRHHQVITAIQ